MKNFFAILFLAIFAVSVSGQQGVALRSTNGVAFGRLTVNDHIAATNTGRTNIVAGRIQQQGIATSGGAIAFGLNTKSGGSYTFVSGINNTSTAAASLVGGLNNFVSSSAANSLVAGANNFASGYANFVVGTNNFVDGYFSSALGRDILFDTGADNTIAMGRNILVTQFGSNDFVWNSDPTSTFTVTKSNSFLVNAPGGIVLNGEISGTGFGAALTNNDTRSLVLTNGNTFKSTNVWDKFNVKFWGAMGDTNTDDTASIQAAVNSLPPLIGVDYGDQLVTNGGTIYIPKGTYKITAPIVLKSYQHLRGDGQASVLWNTSTNTAAISIGDGTNTVFGASVSRLAIRGLDVTNTGAYGIRARFFYRSLIEDVWITGMGDTGILLDGASYSYIRGGYIYNNYGHGIHLLKSDVAHYVTASWVKNCTVRANNITGIQLEGAAGCFVNDNTIESNGNVGVAIGLDGSLGEIRTINLHLKGCSGTVVRDNYLEQSGAFTNQTQIAFSGGTVNSVANNHLANYCGVYLYSSGGSTVYLNIFRDNVFNSSFPSNMITAYYAGDVYPNGNVFIDNAGLNWLDQDTNYVSNTVSSMGTSDGLARGIVSLTPSSTLALDGRPTSGGSTGRIFAVTLTNNLTVSLPVNYATGDTLTFLFSQSGAGAYTVSWDAAFKHVWQDIAIPSATGRSSIQFTRNGASFVQNGGQQPWASGVGGGGSLTASGATNLLVTNAKTTIQNGGANTVVVTNASVGIGTSLPQGPLSINIGSRVLDALKPIIVYQSDPYAEAALGGMYGVNDVNSPAGFGLLFQTFESGVGLKESVRISDDGSVGIGTNSPAAKLHVVGDAIIRTNIAQFDVTVTDFVLGTRYTNSNRRAFAAASFQLAAAVAGTAAVTLNVEQAGVTNKLSISSGPLAGLTTVEPLMLPVGPGAFYYFTDATSGAGAVAAIVAGTSSLTAW